MIALCVCPGRPCLSDVDQTTSFQWILQVFAHLLSLWVLTGAPKFVLCPLKNPTNIILPAIILRCSDPPKNVADVVDSCWRNSLATRGPEIAVTVSKYSKYVSETWISNALPRSTIAVHIKSRQFTTPPIGRNQSQPL